MAYSSLTRQLAFDNLKLLRQQKAITTAEFKRRKAIIDKREAKAVTTARARLQRLEEAKEERRALREGVALMKKMLLPSRGTGRISANNLSFSITVDNEEVAIRDMWKRTVGTTARFIGQTFDRDGEILDKTITVAGGDAGYKSFRQTFAQSDEYRINVGEIILVLKPSAISAERLAQRFRDGINHCVFTPIVAKLNSRLTDASKETAKRLRQRLNKLASLRVQYALGVPEDKMEEVASTSGIKITLYDVLGVEMNVYNKNGRQGSIAMTNTRENHVDIGIVVDSDPVTINQSAMIALWKKLRKDKTFYMIDGNFKSGVPAKIRTLGGAWKLEDATREACEKFDKELGLINYKLNATKQPELNDFIKKGRIVNGWSCDIMGAEEGEAEGCADMPKAYTQFRKCHMYAGFLGHIHQFRSGVFDREFVESHLGYYSVIIKGGITGLMNRLGMYVGMTSVLFSPELLYFMDDGLEVEITQGAWGSRMDFDFPDYMLEDRRYCTWSGWLGVERDETSHTMSSTPQWASHLAVNHSVHYWGSHRLLTIKKPAKVKLTAHHIFGGITAYVRIQMMEAMKCFKPENLIRVVMDGIYYKGEKPAELDWFRDKKVRHDTASMPWYSTVDFHVAPPMGPISKNSLLTGQGGSGKTYSVLTDKGFNNVLFVSPSHILGQNVFDLYKTKYTTIHKLIGIDCRPYYEENRMPSVIVVDEITQLDAEWIDKVFTMYPSSLIILAGDIDADGRWYQCRSGNGDEWSKIWKPSNVDVIDFTIDRRSRDDELKALKLRIRKIMKKCDLECGLFQITEWASRNLPVSVLDFKEGDTCIAGTHRTNQKLLNMGIVSGWYKKGGFVSDKELPLYEKRGSFTIHAYQGKTIETGTVWICIDDLFEYAMLYTAVSRAVSFSQIKFFKSKT